MVRRQDQPTLTPEEFLALRLKVGQFLMQAREDAGLTRAEAAPLAECSESKLYRIERGQSGLSRSDALMMLDAYRVPRSPKTDQLLRDVEATYYRALPDEFRPDPIVDSSKLIAYLRETEKELGPVRLTVLIGGHYRDVRGHLVDLSGAEPRVILLAPEKGATLPASFGSPPQTE